ncbi:hypothetical protein PENTCL1PPCAC_21735, partial [Pristionchus entomophagus]
SPSCPRLLNPTMKLSIVTSRSSTARIHLSPTAPETQPSQIQEDEHASCKAEIERLNRMIDQKKREAEAMLELVDRQRADIRLANEKTDEAVKETARLKLLLSEQKGIPGDETNKDK